MSGSHLGGSGQPRRAAAHALANNDPFPSMNSKAVRLLLRAIDVKIPKGTKADGVRDLARKHYSRLRSAGLV